ncbi:MAG: gliding motility-associated C-terminal domain-containing protein, partial [Crocinitomicaceae bacterium]|nr:gliding motility-associated C-terminal domain-containing protein [Crocinitomicaceae bacterium]
GSSDILGGLCAGDHDIYVEDDNGCTILSTETIGEPTELTIALATVPATCGLDNAEVTITAGGGTPGYTYSNDAGATFGPGNVFTGLAATDYTIVIEDANGCQMDQVVNLSADDLPNIDNVFTVDPLCNGGADGSIEIISSGGVGAHQYSIGGPFQAANLFTGLTAGPYTVFVEDANGCIATLDVELVEPPVLTYNALITDLLCNGDNTGQIELTPAGGTPPYQYSIDNGATFSGAGTFSFIAAGAYDIVIEDANGCQVTGVEVVNEPAVLDWTAFDITNPTCFGDCDGVITTTVGGGTAPYSYFWTAGIEDPANETSGIGACDGLYSVSVTDANGCDLDSLNFVVTEPVPVPIAGVITTDLLCNADATGILEIDAPTAVAYDLPGTAYTSGDATGIYAGLDAGNYDIVAIDAAGCEAITNATLYEPDPIVINMPSDWPTCFGYTVTVQAYVVGGTEPYNWNWTNSLDATVETTSTFDAVITEDVVYTLTITDANGCMAGPDSYTVSPSPTLEVTASAVPDAMICPGETVDLDADATGGQLIDFGPYLGYSYSWDTGIAGDTIEVITVSPTVATDYTVTVTDFCGQSADAVVSIGIHPEPIIDINGGGNGCAPELVTLTNASYVPGGTCLWDFGDGATSTTCGTVSHEFVNSGCYDISLTVTSAEGCVATQTFDDLVCVYDNPEAGFYWTPNSPSILDPTIEVINTSINGETFEYNFGGAFTSFEENPEYTFEGVEEETEIEVCQYILSPEGCPDTLCQIVTIQEEILFFVPNAFTPDGDDYNEEFKPVFTSGVDPYDYHLIIFNRWGEIVFESFNFDNGWPGTYGNQGLVEDGVYIWQIEFGEKATDKKQTHRGHVTVLK